MSRYIDLKEQRFGRLVVLKRSTKRNKNGNVCWLCQCDCGNKVVVEGYALRRGTTKSCGCLRREVSHQNAMRNPTFIKEQGGSLVNQNGIGLSSLIVSKRNHTGVIGVSFDRCSNLYVARLMYHGHYVLNHATKSFLEAVQLRKEAELKYFSHPQ